MRTAVLVALFSRVTLATECTTTTFGDCMCAEEKPFVYDAACTATCTPRTEIITLGTASRSLDVLIVMDYTGSMGDFHVSVKENFLETLKTVLESYVTVDLQVGYLAYSDYGTQTEDQASAFDIIPFSSEFTTVLREIEAIALCTAYENLFACQSNDRAEDVAGAFEQAHIMLESSKNAIIIHVTDSPPHGLEFYTTSRIPEYTNADLLELQKLNIWNPSRESPFGSDAMDAFDVQQYNFEDGYIHPFNAPSVLDSLKLFATKGFQYTLVDVSGNPDSFCKDKANTFLWEINRTDPRLPLFQDSIPAADYCFAFFSDEINSQIDDEINSQIDCCEDVFYTDGKFSRMNPTRDLFRKTFDENAVNNQVMGFYRTANPVIISDIFKKTILLSEEIACTCTCGCTEEACVSGKCTGNTLPTNDINCAKEEINTQNKGNTVDGENIATCCAPPTTISTTTSTNTATSITSTATSITSTATSITSTTISVTSTTISVTSTTTSITGTNTLTSITTTPIPLASAESETPFCLRSSVHMTSCILFSTSISMSTVSFTLC
jgi:hypothetical protein